MKDAERASAVAAINQQGQRRRHVLDRLRRELDTTIAKTTKKLARDYPGQDFTRDIAMLLEQRGQMLRAEHDAIEQRRREAVRAATLTAESQAEKP